LEYDETSGGFAGIGFTVRVLFDPPRAITVAQLLKISDGLSSALDLIDLGGLTFDRALDLLLDGRAEALIGYPENEWLEVKAYPYPLDTDAGKIELAQDVVRFANGNNAALLVIGLRTKRQNGVDIIDKVVPAPSIQLSAQRYRAVLNGRIYPPLVGLNIHTVPVAVGQSLLVVVIPEQPEHLKPFLVHGAIVGEKLEGAFISVIRRSGESSIPTTAPELHALLVAGRRHLQGERST
jgi:hypothetical protein